MVIKKQAFTLVELVLAITVIGLIFSIVSVSLGELRRNARDTKRISDIEQIQLALEEYYRDEGTYPDLLDFDGSLIGSTTERIYMIKVPQNPQPASDKCSWQEYKYLKDQAQNSYSLDFCLERDSNELESGPNCFSPISRKAISINCP